MTTIAPPDVRTEKQAEKYGKQTLKDQKAGSVTVRYRDKDGDVHTVTVGKK